MIHHVLHCRFDFLNTSVKPLSAAGLYWEKVGKCAVSTVNCMAGLGQTRTHIATVLTLGAHAQEGYCSCLVCVCVCVSVCLSVCLSTLAATSFVFTLKSRYVGVCYRLFFDFNSWIFEKTFPSKVMA